MGVILGHTSERKRNFSEQEKHCCGLSPFLNVLDFTTRRSHEQEVKCITYSSVLGMIKNNCRNSIDWWQGQIALCCYRTKGSLGVGSEHKRFHVFHTTERKFWMMWMKQLVRKAPSRITGTSQSSSPRINKRPQACTACDHEECNVVNCFIMLLWP